MPKDTAKETAAMRDATYDSSVGVDPKALLTLAAREADINRRLDAGKKELKQVRKDLKAIGVQLGDWDVAKKMADAKPGDAQESLRHQKFYLTALRSRIGQQLTLEFDIVRDGFDESEKGDEATLEQIITTAKSKGFMAGLTGKPQSDCPHDGNTPAANAWLEGWHEGHKETLTPMPMSDDDHDD